MRRIGAIPGVLLAEFFTRGRPAYAHIGWFVDKGDHAGAHYSLDVNTLLIIVGAISFVVLALVIDRARLPARVQAVGEIRHEVKVVFVKEGQGKVRIDQLVHLSRTCILSLHQRIGSS